MRVKKEFGFLVFLLVTVLFVQDASATTTEILPYSSHYQGRSYYSVPIDGGGIAGRIDFAVYDTLGANGNEFAKGGFTAPGTSRYIYTYQIFCDDISTDPLDYFAILGIGESGIAGMDDVGSLNDSPDDPSEEGIEPSGAYLPVYDPDEGPSKVAWLFEDGLLLAGEHSWFLVLSSDHDWTLGSYELVPDTDDNGGPVPNPEPCAIALLGLGSAILFATRRRKSV